MAKSSGKIPNAEFEFTTDPDGQPAGTELVALFEVQDVIKVGPVEEITESEYEANLRRCIYCGTILDSSHDDTYSEVLTWVRGKNKDSSTLRTYTGRLSCSSHIHNLREGISPTQTGILELADEPAVAVPKVEEAFTDQSDSYRAGYGFGYRNESFPADFYVGHDALAGFMAGSDKREEDRWK